jgi:hypothetical protein
MADACASGKRDEQVPADHVPMAHRRLVDRRSLCSLTSMRYDCPHSRGGLVREDCPGIPYTKSRETWQDASI